MSAPRLFLWHENIDVGTSEWEFGHPQVFREHVQQLASALGPVYALEHGCHLARLDRLQDLDDSLQVCVLYIHIFPYQLHVNCILGDLPTLFICSEPTQLDHRAPST